MYNVGWLWCAFMLGWMGGFAIWNSKHALIKVFDLIIIVLGFLAILICGKV
jgi:hypothetical protein